MKVLSIFYSIFFFILITIPCNDSKKFDTNKNSSKIKIAENNQNWQDDICSPFCACICCVSIIDIPQIEFFDFEWKDSFVANEIPEYYNSFQSEISSGIWQPPKIS